MKFNINDNVKVKLSQAGFDILRGEHEKLRKAVPMLGEFKPPTVDDDGYTQFQLWNLMEVFGKYFYMSNSNYPFQMEIEIPVKE